MIVLYHSTLLTAVFENAVATSFNISLGTSSLIQCKMKLVFFSMFLTIEMP